LQPPVPTAARADTQIHRIETSIHALFVKYRKRAADAPATAQAIERKLGSSC
jgi:hypothetical protein